MKRDMDLIRKILLAAEALADDLFLTHELYDVDERDLVDGHIEMLHSGGYLVSSQRGAYRISWAGYEFLETVRDPEIWRQTKDGASKVGSASIALLGELAAGYLKAKASALGLPMM